MNGFDLAPLLKEGYKRFLVAPALAGLALSVLVFLMGYPVGSQALFRGCILGLLDGVIMLHGIRKALPYDKDPQKGLAIMRRYRWYRVASAGSIIILLLKQGHNVAGVFIGLLLIHIFLIINLTFIAYRLNQVGDVKKGVKNGK